MKRFLLSIALAVMTLSIYSANPNKILIAYFSWGGNTKTVAEYIAARTEGELFEIEPVVPYPTSYTPCTEVALKERDNNARPAIKDKVSNWDDFDVVFIGCPVWWHEAPMIIHTFAESYDFNGKTVVPFCTYASTYRDETLAKIVEITPNANHLKGYGARNNSTSGVSEWLDEIGMIPSERPTTAEAVDLGLSVKWASFNVGATSPEEYGGLYGWGDPTGNLTTENLDDYPSATPPSSICGTEYDIATANWGKEWRMPSQAECEELASKCAWEWSIVNGINGMTVTGTNGNSIFLPAGATRTGTTVSNQVGKRGNYWSGTLWPDNSNFASYLYFYSDATRIQPARSNRRYIGMSVRPVLNDEGAGLDNIKLDEQPDFAVIINGSYLQVNNLSEGTPIIIYDIMGNTIYTGEEHQVNIAKSGVYLIKANNITKKVMI